MTSVVDTTVKNFNSTMSGAPVMNGVAGSMIGVFDACLVTGFDSKSLTSLVVASGVATASFSGVHSAQVDSVILVAGVTGPLAALNGLQKVTVASGSATVKFNTAVADGTAAGTISMQMAPAGWTKVFSGTSLAVYQSSDPAGTKMFLRVDDTSTTFARVVGYEQMSDVNTGTGPFPTAAQISGGGYWPKATAANTTPVPWALYGDGRLFYFSSMPGVSSSASYQCSVTFGFGDPVAKRPGGDAYLCVLPYSINTSVTAMVDGAFSTSSSALMATPRSYTGLGSSSLHTKTPYIGTSTVASGTDSALGAFPSVVDGSLILSGTYIGATVPPRGDIPGWWHVPQSGLWLVFKFLNVVPGTGVLAGRNLQAQVTQVGGTLATAPSNSNGIAFIDITGPWR